MRKLSLLICSLILLSLAACSKPDDGIPPAPTTGTGGGGGDTAPAPTASIMGKVSFEGDAPKPKPIQTSADPACTKELFTEGTKVKDGGLANVIIYVSASPVTDGKNFAAPTTSVEIDQHDCHYIPHAFVLMVGQELSVKNSDNTLHNIHAYPNLDLPVHNDTFNAGQPVQGMITKHVFDKKEILLPLKCEVHKWMGAFIAVVDNPYATVSAEGGSYELKLPAGHFEITAIHELYGKQTAMVDIKDGDKTPVNFKFKAN